MARVKGKVALITGACGGIGAEAARLLVQEGAQAIITDIRDNEGEELSRVIGANYYHLDVSDEDQWQVLADEIQKQYGRLDILFNNAGIFGFSEKFGPQDPEHVNLNDWHYIHKVNLDGIFLGCKYGIRLMKMSSAGSIINMSSRSGLVGIPGAAAYASSKAAVRNHTKTVALYCAEKQYNIRCNSLHPGVIVTPLWDQILGTDKDTREQMISQIESGIPLGRMGVPQDIAYAVLYLASDESRYITGIELTIDGGMLAGRQDSPKKRN